MRPEGPIASGSESMVRPAGLALLDIFGIHVTEEMWFSLDRRGRSDLARHLLRTRKRLSAEPLSEAATTPASGRDEP